MKKNDRRRNEQPSGDMRQTSRRGGGELKNVDMRDHQPNQDFESGAQQAMDGFNYSTNRTGVEFNGTSGGT